MKKALIIVGVTSGILIGGFLFYKLIIQGCLSQKPTALSVLTPYDSATVFINGEHVGATPYYTEDLRGEDVSIKLSSGTNNYETRIRLTPSTMAVLDWDLGVGSSSFSMGEAIWLEKSSSGSMVSVVADPAGSTVRIDGAEVGVTPYLGAMSEGDHLVEVYQVGYERRGVKLKARENYKLNLSVKLFLSPYPEGTPAVESVDGLEIKNLSSDNPLLYSDPATWAKGLSYWLKTRSTGEEVLGLFLDYDGNVYDATSGVKLTSGVGEALAKGAVAYLGRVQDDGLSEAARTKLEELTGEVVENLTTADGEATAEEDTTGTEEESVPEEADTTEVIPAGTYAEISPTGTGWLRVRSEPVIDGTNENEIAKVDVGEKFPYLEEKNGWVKIKLTTGKTGWVSGTFIKKVTVSE